MIAKYKISWPAKYLEHYLIELLAYFQALRRANEYTADRIAVELVGKQAAAQSLIGCSVIGNWVGEHYCKHLLATTRYIPTPDVAPYACLYDFCRSRRFTVEELVAMAKSDLTRTARLDETHPALGERLKALDTQFDWELTAGPCAAECWFGNDLQTIIDDMDRGWRKHYRKGWGERHMQHIKQRAESNRAMSGVTNIHD